MGQHKYKVIFENFTKRHFIKTFEKKYKSKWNQTQDDIIFMCEHIDNMLLTKRADLISIAENHRLAKLDFAIFGIKISPKASGNRCILAIDDDLNIVRILLVYSKNDIPAKNETQEWKNIIKAHYSDVASLFNL
ncbi:hypothetical protein IKL45_03625 [Candidatus Saccharibacteria bacterium]|nr:hypothetical protein [Candidatus Saccharibacteria bacterium]MBR6122258.1 hypothetical protein [Candidatus Saccharibacteria bacterium]